MSLTDDRAFSRDAIERFLDRGWILERIPLHVADGHRSALGRLDDWMLKNRVATLTTASSSDIRALLNSSCWDKVSRGCDSLLGLITRFYHSLQECKFRADDPVETLIDQELAMAAHKSAGARTERIMRRGKRPVLRPQVA